MSNPGHIPTRYIKNGSTFRVTNTEAHEVHELLPAANYIISVDAFGNFFLERVDAFESVPKVYGNSLRHRDRILTTFQSRPGSTGVMLVGEKGSGKTLLSRELCIRGAELGIPTIIINSPMCGDKFNHFMQSISQPCIILFDEFEKVYDSKAQEEILTLLDGVFTSKKLFMLTSNDKYRVDYHMRNRPGRIFYMIEFGGLSTEFIQEYLADKLVDQAQAPGVLIAAQMFTNFSFDMLKALVEEMNRYSESAKEALEMLNAAPEFDGDLTYEVALTVDGKAIVHDMLDDKAWHGNPLRNKLKICIDYFKSSEDAEEHDTTRVVFEPGDLVALDQVTGAYKFTNIRGNHLTLTRRVLNGANYRDLF